MDSKDGGYGGLGTLALWFGDECPVRVGLPSGHRTSPELGLPGPEWQAWSQRGSPFQLKVLRFGELPGAIESRLGFGGLPRCLGWGTDAASRLLWALLLRFVTCRVLTRGLGLPVQIPAFVPGLRVCTLGTRGGRRGSQEGGPKGAGSVWREAASCTFWQLHGSARLRPLCALLPALPRCWLRDLTSRFLSFS